MIARRGGRRAAAARHLRRNADLYGAGAAACLFTAHLFTTPELFFGSGTDLPRMEYPFHRFATQWLSRGVLPFWNPLILGGVPFQGGVHGVLYPGWWSGVLLPAGLDLKVSILVHQVLFAVGGAFFARGRVTTRAASWLAGTTCALSAFGTMQLFAGHLVVFGTAAWLPWVAGLLDRSLRQGRRWLLAAAAASGVMILCGNYQVAFMGLGGLLAFLVLDRALAGGLRPAARAAAHWGVAVAGGALLAAVQILPMAANVVRSQRAEGGLAFASLFASHPVNLLTYLVPDLFGDHLERPFVGAWPFWDALGYLGIVPLALLAFALGATPPRRWLAPAVVAAGALLLSFADATPLFGVYLALVPGADLFRTASRFCLLATLFGSLLAAQGLDAWRAGLSRAALVRGCTVLAGVGVAALVLWIALRPSDPGGLASALFSYADPLRWGALGAAGRGALLEGGARTLAPLLLLLATAGLLAAGARSARLATLASAVLLTLHLADLYHFGHRYLRTAPAAALGWPEELAAALRARLPDRLRLVPPPEHALYNVAVPHDIGSPGGYDTFLDARYARYLNRSQGRPLDHFFSLEPVGRAGPLIRQLGVGLVVTTQPLHDGANRFLSGYDGFEPAGRLGALRLYADPDPVPRVNLVHATEVIDDELASYARMEAPDFDVRRRVILEAPLPPALAPQPPGPGPGPEGAEILAYEPNRVTIRVEASSRAVLVLSDLMAPGWSARVDGAPVPMLPANRVMRAVPVPAGTHEVVMRYRPPGFAAGALLSGLAWGGLAVAAVAGRRPA